MKAASTQGVIINVTSAAGLRGGLSPVDYACSKAAVIAITQQAACELAPDGIRVNSVAPSYVSTVRWPSTRRACHSVWPCDSDILLDDRFVHAISSQDRDAKTAMRICLHLEGQPI